ncbi:CdaR family transcriptional regulator [Leucobacter luti]|uniref:PucR family transcriptional regulator n=1 Tax=Leucobacter luti TaxID=340320 RepID=UPI001C68D782|nr:helix-turn-helix domain-containing protein [Leucobacter luti]QYM75692.1 helix-turn-helix domain-containing protein [Leucobacter luti]
MALDLSAVVRLVGGTCVPQRIDERTPIDGVTPVEAYVVVGNPNYATLVTGDEQELLRRLTEGGAIRDALTGAVFISHRDTPALRASLATHGMTAILGTDLGGVALHATLTTIIADDRAAADRLVTAGMNVLTQVARRGGVTAVIAELARRIDGWAVLLDSQGHLIASAGAGRLHVSDAIAIATGRPVRVRHDGLQLHPVGSDRDLAGRLVIATRSSRTSHARDLASLAAALFDLVLRTHDPSLTEHLGRQALLDTLSAGGPAAPALLHRWGVHESTLTAFELGAKTRTIDAERLLRRWFDELGAEHVFAASHGRVRGFVRSDVATELAVRVREFTPIAGSRLHLGIGTPAPTDALARSAVQARQALDAAFEDSLTVVEFAGLSTVELVFSTLADHGGGEIASVLDPLRDSSGAHTELALTLRVFLAEHGAHRSSAERLGIHRQTLVSRVRRVEELTGLSMDRADDRAAAWLALRAAGV